MIIHPVDTLDEPDLQPYRTLRRPMDHQRNGIFVAEGEKVVARLLESRLEILSLLVTPDWLDVYRDRIKAHPGTIRVHVAPKHLVESIVGFHLHQGIMAVAKIPEPVSLTELLQRVRRPMLLVAVDGLTNAENLGVLVRNCAAFEVDGILVGETSSSPYLRRAVRNSMGTVFRMPVVHVPELVQAIREMQSAFNVHVVAAHPHADQATLYTASMTDNCCIVFGSEGEGIGRDVLAACSESVAIPMREGVDSLNVASASAVFLYEIQRQRRNQGFGTGGGSTRATTSV